MARVSWTTACQSTALPSWSAGTTKCSIPWCTSWPRQRLEGFHLFEQEGLATNRVFRIVPGGGFTKVVLALTPPKAPVRRKRPFHDYDTSMLLLPPFGLPLF